MNRKLLLALLAPCAMFAQTLVQDEINSKWAASQQNVLMPTLESNSVLVCDAIDVPYSENFNGVTPPATPDCGTIENAGNGNNFTTAPNPGYGFTTNVLRYQWHTSNPANAWYFTQGLNLTAGQPYVLSYKYGSAGSTVYTEKLKVHIGTAAASSSMSAAPLIDHPLVNNNVTPITDNLTFTPETDGVYYFGFNCYSNVDQFYLFIDDISVTPNLAVGENNSVKFSISPNPVIDVLNIIGKNQIDSIVILNSVGQSMIETTVGQNDALINLGQLPAGIYFAKVKSGNSVETRKILKD